MNNNFNLDLLNFKMLRDATLVINQICNKIFIDKYVIIYIN